MGEWEMAVGVSDDWYTPPYIFNALGIRFDIDVASPGYGHWVPADRVFTKEDDGLAQEWSGTVFMNPPFGGRNGHVPWLKKFIAHGDGIAILSDRVCSGWFHDWIPKCHAILFPRGKPKFIRPDGSVGKQPGSGVIFVAMGEKSVKALMSSGLGLCLMIQRT